MRLSDNTPRKASVFRRFGSRSASDGLAVALPPARNVVRRCRLYSSLAVICIVAAGCTHTRTEYVYVQGPTIEVPVYRPDTLALPVYREYIALYESHVSAFDTLSVRTEKSLVQAANAEGAWLRKTLDALVVFMRQEVGRWERK